MIRGNISRYTFVHRSRDDIYMLAEVDTKDTANAYYNIYYLDWNKFDWKFLKQVRVQKPLHSVQYNIGFYVTWGYYYDMLDGDSISRKEMQLIEERFASDYQKGKVDDGYYFYKQGSEAKIRYEKAQKRIKPRRKRTKQKRK